MAEKNKGDNAARSVSIDEFEEPPQYMHCGVARGNGMRRDRPAIGVPQTNLEAYCTALPELLDKCPGKWIAYHNGRRYGPFETEFEALDACMKKGIPRDERLIRLVEPEPTEGNRMHRLK